MLGGRAEVGALRDLSHPGVGRIVVFEQRDRDLRGVLKSYDRRWKARSEARNLAIANRSPEVKAPRLLGAYGRHVAYEYVEGTQLARVETAAPHETLRRYAQTAIRNLQAVHGAAERVREADRLGDPFRRDALERSLLRIRARILEVGLPAWSERTGESPERWRHLLSDALIRGLADDLRATPEARVLGHGDYQGSNLILTPAGEIRAVDWFYASWASPWYDLAYPIQLLGPQERDELVSHYLEGMQRRGRLRGVSEERARELSRSGIIYQKAILARANARMRGSPQEAYRAQEFRKALDALAALLG
jgi:aminoglycoside phosphotransferase (APT) family kinase protein